MDMEKKQKTKGKIVASKIKEEKKTKIQNLDEVKEQNKNAEATIEMKKEELTNTDFIPYSEIDSYVQYLGKNTHIPGFRKGKVFLPILYTKFPQASEEIISFYVRLKVMAAEKQNKKATFEKIIYQETGLLINYKLEDIKETDKKTEVSDTSEL